MWKQRNNKGGIKVSVEESGCPGQSGSPDALIVKLMSSDLPVETSGGTGGLLGRACHSDYPSIASWRSERSRARRSMIITFRIRV